MAAFTAAATWTAGTDWTAFDTARQELDTGPAVLRDYTKSMKYYWHDAAYIPGLADGPAAWFHRPAVARAARRGPGSAVSSCAGLRSLTGAEVRTRQSTAPSVTTRAACWARYRLGPLSSPHADVAETFARVGGLTMAQRVPPTPPTVTPGTQPEAAGRLQCLVCGRWFRQLGQHVVATHRVSADDYRARFGLPAGRGLHGSQVRAVRAEHARRQWEQDLEFRLRFRPSRTTAAERVARAAAARRATASRPAVRSAATAGGNAVHRAWLASIDANADKAAMAAGFRDLDSMLQATRALPAHEVARLLNLTTKQVWALRRRHGHPSTGGGRPPGLGADDERQCLQCGRWYRGLGQHIVMAHRISLQDYRNQHPIDPATLENSPAPPIARQAQRAALTPHELARIPRGEQPDDGTGRLLCLTCGHWYRGLGQHIAVAHRMPVTDYRRHHGLQASQRRSR